MPRRSGFSEIGRRLAKALGRALGTPLTTPAVASTPALTYDRDTRAVMYSASSLTSFYRRATLIPEITVLVLIQDELVRSLTSADLADAEARLEHAALTLPAERDAGGAWSARAKRSLHAAWQRAYGRPSALVTRGDLLSGLAGASGLAAEIASGLAIDPRALDREDPPLASGDASSDDASGEPSEVHQLRLVIDNDETTPMDAVAEILRENLGYSQPRAVLSMLRTHFRDSEGLVTLPPPEARKAIERCRAAARDRGLSLSFRLIPG